MWPTPQHRENGGGEYADPQKALARMTSGHQVNLQDAVKAMASMWPTPMAGTPAQNGNSEAGNNDSSRKTVDLAHGTALDGSSATTGKRGVLNPAFPCWLMGFPLAHLSCGATAMASFRKLPRKSSQL
jgi:hypothetical protein